MSLQIVIIHCLFGYWSIGSDEMQTICQISYMYTTCNLEHNSLTIELPTLRMMSEENGLCVNIVYAFNADWTLTWVECWSNTWQVEFQYIM